MICLFVVILHSRHISYHVHSIPSTSFGHGHDGFSFAFYRFINKLFIVINSHVAWLHALNVCACLTFFNFIITLWYNLSACSAVFNALYITEKGTKVIFCHTLWCTQNVGYIEMLSRRENGVSERERDSGGGKGKKKEMSEESGKKRKKASTYSRFFFSFNTNSFGCSTLNNAINSALTAQHLLHLLLLQLWLSMGLRALCVDVDCGHIYSTGLNDKECESSESFSILYTFFQKG